MSASASSSPPHNDEKDSSPPLPLAPSIFVPQLYPTHAITVDDLETAIRVLNAMATLNTNTNDDKQSKRPSSNENGNKRKANETNNDQNDDKDTNSGIDAYKQPNLRPFRKALASCLELHQRTMFQGLPEEDHYDQRRQERSLKRQKMAERDLYQKHIATTALRKGRVDRLQAALAEGATTTTTILEEEQQQSTIASSSSLLQLEQQNHNRLLAIQDLMVPDGHVDTDAMHRSEQQDNTGIGMTTLATMHTTPTVLPCLRSCYVCKLRYRELHAFYDQLCPQCAIINWTKRLQTANLTGLVAVVTGSRVKIGYQVCLKLLRAGASVVATSRFPNAAVHAYRQEADFDVWKNKLHVYGLDLRDVAGLEAFTRFLKQQFVETGIDMVINNACQTIRRPVGYFKPAVAKEQQLWNEADSTHKDLLQGCAEFERLRRRIVHYNKDQQHEQTINFNRITTNDAAPMPHLLPASSTSNVSHHNQSVSDKTHLSSSETAKSSNGDQLILSSQTDSLQQSTLDAPFESTGLSHSTAMSQMIILPEDGGVSEDILPPGVSDINGQQLDLRTTNSWVLKMEEVSTPELMECMFVNAIAPFVLNSRLKPLMTLPEGDSRPDRYIINVSAMEGKVSVVMTLQFFRIRCIV